MKAYRGDQPFNEWLLLREQESRKELTMSREWRRAPSATFCGSCKQRVIAQDEPVLYITIPGVKKPRLRCTDCAGEAPPDLPANLQAGGIEPSGFTRVGSHGPKRTRGDLRAFVDKWSPYRESE